MSNKAIRYISMPSGDVLSFAGPQYCTCSSSATSSVKSITLQNIDSVNALPYGYAITVRMKNAQLYNGTPSLSVNGSQCHIYCANGVPATYNEWGAGDVLMFTYGESEVETEVEGEVYFESAWFIVNGSSISKDIATLAETKSYLGIS